MAAATVSALARGHGFHGVVGQILESLILGDKVGLGAELEQSAIGGGHQAVGGGAFCPPLGRFGLAADPKDLNSLVKVAVGFGQRLLAVHHACAGRVAKLLHISSGNRCHEFRSSSYLLWVRCRQLCVEPVAGS